MNFDTDVSTLYPKLTIKQRTKLWTVVSAEYYRIALQEFNTIESALIGSNITNVLDIGAGLAGYQIFVNKVLAEPNFYFLDRNKEDAKMIYGFRNKTEAYNNFAVTKEFLINAGIAETKMQFIDAETADLNQFSLTNTAKFDLVMSLYSYCFHYPYEIYRDLILNTLADNGIFIVDLRKIKTEQAVMQNAQIYADFTKLEVLQSVATSDRVVLKKIAK